MVYEAGSIHCNKKWPPRRFKLTDFLKFLKLGLKEMTSASGHRPRVRAVYPSLPATATDYTVRPHEARDTRSQDLPKIIVTGWDDPWWFCGYDPVWPMVWLPWNLGLAG